MLAVVTPTDCTCAFKMLGTTARTHNNENQSTSDLRDAAASANATASKPIEPIFHFDYLTKSLSSASSKDNAEPFGNKLDLNFGSLINEHLSHALQDLSLQKKHSRFFGTEKPYSSSDNASNGPMATFQSPISLDQDDMSCSLSSEKPISQLISQESDNGHSMFAINNSTESFASFESAVNSENRLKATFEEKNSAGEVHDTNYPPSIFSPAVSRILKFVNFRAGSQHLSESNAHAVLMSILQRYGPVHSVKIEGLTTGSTNETLCTFKVAYFDIRHAYKAYCTLKRSMLSNEPMQSQMLPSGDISFDSIVFCSNKQDAGNIGDNSFVIFRTDPPKKLGISSIRAILSRYGNLRTCKVIRCDNSVEAEFMDSRDCLTAISELNGSYLASIKVLVALKENKKAPSMTSSESKPEVRQSDPSPVSKNRHNEELFPDLKLNIESNRPAIKFSANSNFPLVGSESIWAPVQNMDGWSNQEFQNTTKPQFSSSQTQVGSTKLPLTSLDLNQLAFPSSQTTGAQHYKSLSTGTFGNFGQTSQQQSQQKSHQHQQSLQFQGLQTQGQQTALSQSSNQATATAGLSNIVDTQKILSGLEKRTTVMIKNIPNKLSQGQLEAWLNTTSARNFDFLYLRMDFSNKCNVGYAFVNFISPLDVVEFCRSRVGQAWNFLYSEKICDISWANIQGKDALVEKFRNSSVMDEQPSYRPKIYVSSGPNRGQPEEFPLPNDLRRKIKSIINAQHLGLFSKQIK